MGLNDIQCLNCRRFISYALVTVYICLHKQGQTKIMLCFYFCPIFKISARWSYLFYPYTMITVIHRWKFPKMLCLCDLKQAKTYIKLLLVLPIHYLDFRICFSFKLPGRLSVYSLALWYLWYEYQLYSI